MTLEFETTVKREWTDYNCHMRDSYYGLVFSLAVDAVQDEVGLDAAYRKRTGCTVYLVEDHKYYLREVVEGDRLRVSTRVLGVDDKRFHLYMVMTKDSEEVCVGEFMEMHVQQHPRPHSTAMPIEIRKRLMTYLDASNMNEILSWRSRQLRMI